MAAFTGQNATGVHMTAAEIVLADLLADIERWKQIEHWARQVEMYPNDPEVWETELHDAISTPTSAECRRAKEQKG